MLLRMDAAIANVSTILTLTEIEEASPAEVFSVTFFVPMSTLFIWLLSSIFNFSSKLEATIEVLVINVVLLVALTSLSNYHLQVFLLMGILLLAMGYYVYNKKITYENFGNLMPNTAPETDLNRKFIGDYRGHLLLATSVCILAVDFSFFPSRFAKNDTFGWSVMDAGVGSFVLIHGLSSTRESSNNSNSLEKKMIKGVASSFPFFFLGLVRLSAITVVGYHKVIPEYGIHWNFFFTLGFTKAICSMIPVICHTANYGLLAAVILAFHQVLLSNGLTEFILSEERKTLVEANKEGFCSLLGFVSIYFCGAQLGCLIWRNRYKMKDYVQLLIKLCAIGVSGWILMNLFNETIQPTSRRMANLAYCIWVVSLTSLQMAVHLFHQMIIVIFSKGSKRSCDECLLWKAVNYNGLAYFMLANLMTGIVNLTFRTNECSESQSFLILVIYLLFLSGFAVCTLKHSIRIKF